MTKARDLANLGAIASSGIGFRNRIINGAMMIDQRYSGGPYLAAGNGIYLVDRWRTISTIANKMTYQQNQGSLTPPTGFTAYLGMTATTADSSGTGWWGVEQGIEGLNLSDLAYGTSYAQTVTVSFWARASIAGTYSFSLFSNNGSTTRSIVQTYTINSANTWEYKTLTFVGDTSTTMYTNTNQGIAARWDLGTNAGATTSTLGQWITGNYMRATGSVNWIATANATFQITGVQLEKGSTATSFDYRPYGTELALCQRYYQRWSSTNGSYLSIGSGNCITAGTINRWGFPLSINLRTSPTINLVNCVGWDGNVGGAASVAINYSSTNNIDIDVTTSSMTVGLGHMAKLLINGATGGYIETVGTEL
ncbi:hypothetical protein [Polynucleobacter sp. UK-Kesae-W10]|uniref:hypothetical protein n=1 Tax=Polynucleobacter sp. UK-Kesae-W10 TaxID=1819738 RepID=UPI001C0C354B|nr:hypothetical protein [Polynucleobacter sp. UK-Kesae-W10]MBU3577591.1 hypothetical protein [Polynucleobacter sp. UK-Kesae-W10]